MIRLQNERQTVDYLEPSTETRMMNYNLQFHPLETMSLSLSFTDYWGFIQQVAAQENTSVLSQFHGSLLPALNMSTEVGFNRNIQFIENKEFNTWNYSFSFDGDVSQKIGALVSYSYRESREIHSGMRIAQQRASGNLTSRLTRTILLSGEADVVEDGSIYVNQQYNLNWRLFPKLSFGAQTAFTTQQDGGGSERYNFYASYEFARNGNLYCQYNKSESWASNGENNMSMQVGIHIGF